MSSVSIRSYLTAGIAVVGAGAMALTPVQPVSVDPALAPKAASQLAVNLASTIDPITPITNALAGALQNVGTLVNNWVNGQYVAGTLPFPPNTVGNGQLGNRTGGYATGVPLPILNQVVLNSITYLGELPDFGLIVSQIGGNISNALGSLVAPGEVKGGRVFGALPSDYYNQNVNAVPYFDTPFGPTSQRDVPALLNAVLPDEDFAPLLPLLNITSTPISGLLVGVLGPILGPVISVVNSVQGAISALGDSDFLGAINSLINLPANAINAFLNGGPTLDLTSVVGMLGIQLPDLVQSIGLKMGGLLSPGGVALDALSAQAAIPDVLTLDVPGLPVGPIGALLGLTNYVAKAITVTPPAPTASVRAAAADAPSEAELAEIAAPVADDGAADVQVEVTSVTADEPVALTAERTEDAPAPVQHRQSRRAAAASDGEKASPTRGSAAAKAASAGRSAR